MADELINTRKTLKSRLTKIQNYVKSFKDTNDIEHISVRNESLKDIWTKYEQVQIELERIDHKKYSQDRDEVEEQYYEVKAKIQSILNKKQRETVFTNPTSVKSDNEQSTKVKLPQLKIPEFEGRYEQWRGFYDVFKSVIHENNSISDVEKLFYLKSALKGEALKTVQSIPATGKNYQVALQILKDTYDNELYIINAHIEAILSFPQISRFSAVTLRSMTSETKQHLYSLETLGVPVKKWDLIIIHILTGKLDQQTRTAWDLHKSNEKRPTLDELFKFLEHRCKSLGSGLLQDKVQVKPKVESKPRAAFVSTREHSANQCKLCDKEHYLFHCEKFLSLNVRDRLDAVKNSKICFNCLRPSHMANQCTASKCTKCGRNHNTLIHIERNQRSSSEFKPTQESTLRQPQESKSNEEKVTCVNSETSKHVLLATAIVQIKDKQGNWRSARALLDSASQSNLITKDLINRLGIKGDKTDTKLTGISQTHARVNQSTELQISSKAHNYHANLEFLILDKITCDLPQEYINIDEWNIPSYLQLADPKFNHPNKIDCLIGAEIYFELLNKGRVKLDEELPTLIDTKLGWIVSGRHLQDIDKTMMNHISMFINTQQDSNNELLRFWELEEIPSNKVMTKEETECEEYFKQTTKRDEHGRYIVNLPLKDGIELLGNSYHNARSRFNYLQGRLSKDKDLNLRYTNFMDEYKNLHHMEKVPDSETNSKLLYYIPHQAVIKDSSTTTKLRVVFDASMKTDTGLSLNDVLKVGPTVHQDLFSIVMRFRLYRYAFTADIQKMYRQILVNEKHRDLQRIIWTNNGSTNIQEYRLKTVTYGTACAPYLATKCLQQLALDEGDAYPLAKPTLQNDFYVDDVMTGSNNLSEVQNLQKELINLLEKGGFKLHKWCSNSQEIIQAVKPELRETSLPLVVGKDAIKTLGLLWLPAEDTLKFMINLKNPKGSCASTKRTMLSDIASIFDPLGLLGPMVIRAKLFIQELWKHQIAWDETLDKQTQQEWDIYRAQLHELRTFQIPRRMIHDTLKDNITYEIHGFSDASQRAYGACIYLKSQDSSNNTSIRLICAKSRVAPVKQISLPRLELCGAVILARLQQKVIKSLQIKVTSIFLWTDSTIVLHWISASPLRWKVFVANRVTEIQDLTSSCTWKHVGTNDNPADHLSRGLSATELQESHLWWNGPEWLMQEESHWPQQIHTQQTEELEVREQRTVVFTCTNAKFELIERYSSFNKLNRIVAYCLRFIHNMRMRTIKERGPLTLHELRTSTHRLIRIAQQEEYRREINDLLNNKAINYSSLKSLTPFLDSENILRVGGRLDQCDLKYDHKHPIILPNKHKLTSLILKHTHIQLLHAGVQAMLGTIREKYWPVKGRSTIRKIIHQCHTCFRLKAKQATQLMGDIPSCRSGNIRPFSQTGVDYGGPFQIKASNRKNAPLTKAYVALFICLATRAIHLELVSSLSTEAFLSALRRFISRRGKCSIIHSDNATNFKGANNELHDLFKLFQEENFRREVVDTALQEEIQWKFIPPNAPHFGGLWEAGIKSVKFHLKRVIGKSTLTFEQFYTLLTQIEACVNSRPICPLSDDPTDNLVLTPAHFLVGSTLTGVPEPQLAELPDNRLSIWQLLQKRVQSFWKKWSHDYLHTLQQRSKWNQEMPNIPVDAIVLIKDDNHPPMHWALGRVLQVHPGPDRLVRVVTIRTSTGTFKRPISKLCLLPREEQSQNF